MATFKYLVLPHQLKADGTYNVKIRVTHNGKSKYIKTPHYVSSVDISKKKEKGKEKIKIKNQAIVDLMNEVILSYRRKLVEVGSFVDTWDVDQVTKYLTEQNNKDFKLDIIDYGRKYANQLEAQGKIGTAKQYKIAMNSLARFAGESVDINTITVSFLKSYEKHIREEPTYKGLRSGVSIPTKQPKGGRAVSLYMSHLRTLFKAAKLEYNDEDRGIINIPLSPFSRYKIPDINASEHRVLTIEQIQEIINIPYMDRKNDDSTFNLAKDVFMLSFALMGMNTADLYEATGYSNCIISYNRKKTRTRRKDKALMKIRVEPEIMNLFEKYKGKERVFCFCNRYKDSDIFNKMINVGLKKIGELIGVPKLNFYYARHTMASICANKLNIDIARVDEMLNHSDPKLSLARVYIEKDFTPLWEANRKLIDLFDWSFYNKNPQE